MPWRDGTKTLSSLNITIRYKSELLSNGRRIYLAEVEFSPTDRCVIFHRSQKKLDDLVFQVFPIAYYARLNLSSL